MRTKNKLFLLFLIVPFISFSQSHSLGRNILWTGIEQVQISENETIELIRFDGSMNDYSDDLLPAFYERIPLDNYEFFSHVELANKIFEPIPFSDIPLIEGSDKINSELNIESNLAFDRKMPYATLRFIPIQKNKITGFYERLTSFDIVLVYDKSQINPSVYKSGNYKENSVLATGNWYKVAVSNTGVHKISYNELSDLGMDVNSLNPKHIRVYGNGGGMLPENINEFRYDDLQENAIHVRGEDDESFDSGDYVLFYAESPNEWKYVSTDQRLHKTINLYSDYNYYYITADMGAGKRIHAQTNPPNLTPTFYSNKFTDAYHYEVEEENLISTGRIWYGETFDLYNNMEKEITFPNIDLSSKVYLAADVAARSSITSSFGFYANDQLVRTLSIPPTNSSNINADYAKTRYDSTSFDVSGSTITIKIVYSKPLASSVGYLNFFTLNVVRKLVYGESQLIFRDTRTADNSYVTEYSMASSNPEVTIWNITDRINVSEMVTNYGNGNLKFIVESDELEEFIAFDGSSFYTTTPVGKINNQNLHGSGDYEMIIVVHPDFIEEANDLADHHINFDDMSVLVVELPQIYNEFSSGAQDISAIRDFVKLMYDKAATGNEPKYLLLFGDASFDYKDRIPENSNYVPTWESPESLNPVGSYIKDDFFGLLDGDPMIDIGIGRFVVSSVNQARDAVDKTIHYAVNTNEVMGDWRNIICLIADDEDNNLHFNDAEKIAYQIDTSNRDINIDKIYLDAYEQVSTPSGERYPKVTQDINTRVDRGALMMNYIGHGGELGLAHERILKIADINSWTNYDNMPVFITATCEFSRFDDAERTSAGEYVFLNPNGGGIALFTTTRATYAGGNLRLNKNINKYALNKFDGEYLRMGDVIRYAKNATGSDDNTRKFALLGDPALHFAHPEHNVATATINNISVLEVTDTIKALSEVTITGQMQDYAGNKLSNFNGTLFPIVFDKPSKYTTQANDPASNPVEFYIQKNALYKGKASVINGEWSFSFIVPKDIAYNYGYGKLSYYAKSDTEDAAGNYMDFIVGGYNDNATVDNEGPVVSLYMNDDSFVYGGVTDENPSLFAYVYDESGINTVGSGIGHDILGTLDETTNYVLNDYYESELNDFKNGTINYPFFKLPNGRHQLSLKVWDIYNNSTTVYTEFVVADSHQMALESVMNYPNPFIESTQFSFEHNQPDQPLEVTIRIFSLAGQLVTTLTDDYYAGGYRYNSLAWNGTDENGSKLNQGMYIYKILVRNYDGSVSEGTDKLIILR